MALSTYLTTEAGDRIITEAGDYLTGERSYPQFQAYNIFDLRANWASDPSESMARAMTVLENVTGLPLVRSHTVGPVGSFEMMLSLTGRTEIAEFRSWLRAFKGRQTPVWVPSWVSDLVPTQDPTGSTIYVESVDYAARLYPHNARKYLAIIDHEWTINPVAVTGASDNGTTETLTISPALSGTLPKEHTLISFLLLARLEQDGVTTKYYGRDYAEVTMQFTEVPREAPSP